jgi:hypothetical protein
MKAFVGIVVYAAGTESTWFGLNQLNKFYPID